MELDFRMMESTSPFSILFEESNRKKWDPFVEVTEEKQEKLLISIEITTRQKDKCASKKEQDHLVSPDHSFTKVDKKIRKLLRKYEGTEFLNGLDHDIVDYISVSDIQAKVYHFSDSFHRLLCHGVCQFYSLQSKSEIYPNKADAKKVIVTKSKTLLLPNKTLSQYLFSLPNNS